MKRSLTIAKVAGVPIRVHWSFSLLLVLVVLSPGGTTASVLATNALWLAALFGSVTLHELSHSVVAMRLGLKVRDIVLLPIGGVSEIEGMGTSPAIEFRVAIAGPLASIVLGGVFLLLAWVTHATLWPPTFSGGSWLVRLGWLNLGLAAFNLLPALPLDGGRVFRSVLARSGDKLRATRIAAVVAGVFGVAIMAFGFVRDYFLVFIGAFVLMGANAEWQNARFGAALSGMKVGTVFHADATTVPAGVPAVQVAEWLSHFPGRAVPVVDEAGRYVGIVNQGDVTGALPEMTAGQAADRVAPVLTPDADLIPTAAEAFQSAHRKQLAVVADGRPVGVLYLQAVNAALTNAHQDRARVGRF